MKRLLCLTTGMNTGGAETFLMKVYRQLDRAKYQMDFCVTIPDNYYADEIRTLGGKLYMVPRKSKNPVANFLGVRKIVRENQYDYVIRVCENSLATLDLLAAKAGGAKHLAMRSSNANSASKIVRVLHKMFFFLPRVIPNIKIAPSRLAAEYTFGKKAVASGDVLLLQNGIDTEKFRFSQTIRDDVRSDLNAGNNTIIGHVGRFSNQKNHKKLIEIFHAYHALVPDSQLWLVGTGPLEEAIRQMVASLGISDAVRFLGVRSDVNRLLMGMDVFVFPSFYEGMPNTVIEAQATGLRCLIADTITPEADVNGLVRYMPLEETSQSWANQIQPSVPAQRCNAVELMKSKGYEMADVVNTFVRRVFDAE